MILYAGLDNSMIPPELDDASGLREIFLEKEEMYSGLLAAAEVILLGPAVKSPVTAIQKIYAGDKHISVVLLTMVSQVKQVKNSIKYAPYIGNNTTVVTLLPEMDLKMICMSASQRTRQKRGFHKLNIESGRLQNTTGHVKLAQMGSFLEYAPIGALLLSEDGSIVNFNQQAKKLFPALESINIELSVLFPETVVTQINQFIHSSHHPEEKMEIVTGQRTVELSSTKVYSEEGVEHYLLLLSDITHEKFEAQRIQSILESLPQMAFTTDAEGQATYFTHGWYFYTGQLPHEPLGGGWVSVVLQEDLEKVAESWKRSVESGKPYQHAARYRNSRGEYRWHLARVTPVRDITNQVKLWVGTCTDIHDQILLTEELERRVKERTHALEMSNSELEQFAHVSSHDLQEPLRKIRTFADLLKNAAYADVNDDAKRYIDKITSTAERMSNSLRSLLQYTRLDSEKSEVPVDINEVISHIMQDLEVVVSHKKARIQCYDLPVVIGVQIQLQQLFYNLVNNALKFSKKDQPPVITISAADTPPEIVEKFTELNRYKNYSTITVTDNGIGFDQQHAEKIFSIFKRLHPKTEYEGTGIGLSIVKKVVRNHGGVIIVNSKSGEGTSFQIILPR